MGLGLARLAAAGLGAFLFRTTPADPYATGAAMLIILAVALSAAVGPARRALLVDPVSGLRDDR
jgi:hypothetical protein